MRVWGRVGKPANNQCPPHVETSQLIRVTNQLTGFYMRGTLVVNGLSNLVAKTKEYWP